MGRTDKRKGVSTRVQWGIWAVLCFAIAFVLSRLDSIPDNVKSFINYLSAAATVGGFALIFPQLRNIKTDIDIALSAEYGKEWADACNRLRSNYSLYKTSIALNPALHMEMHDLFWQYIRLDLYVAFELASSIEVHSGSRKSDLLNLLLSAAERCIIAVNELQKAISEPETEVSAINALIADANRQMKDLLAKMDNYQIFDRFPSL